MASPPETTMENLTGTWTLDKTLSSDADPLLALQGLNWVVRKAVGVATVTIKMKQFTGSNPQTSTAVEQISMDQFTSTGLGGTSDNRYFDWTEHLQEDHIFGKTAVRSRFIAGTVPTSSYVKVRPDVEVQARSDDVNIRKFLQGEIGEDLAPCEGFIVEDIQKDAAGEKGLWANVVIRSQVPKWIAEQVWGFEIVNNERRYVRRTVVSDRDGNYRMARLVYSFVGSNSD